MSKEPIVHSTITDCLPEDHPLAHEEVFCADCKAMLHAFNNECMQPWLEFPDANLCWECGTCRV